MTYNPAKNLLLLQLVALLVGGNWGQIPINSLSPRGLWAWPSGGWHGKVRFTSAAQRTLPAGGGSGISDVVIASGARHLPGEAA
ncbi:MAG: hypothetical protein AUK51_15790 [Comamonadaceae bacterium CG2_30_59_20]|nr:MAG: hypothetical protein AUK51_15790 [Comamonadaceae bacterium CG2_30_59_20]